LLVDYFILAAKLPNSNQNAKYLWNYYITMPVFLLYLLNSSICLKQGNKKATKTISKEKK